MRTLGEEPPEDSVPNPERKKIMEKEEVLNLKRRYKSS